MNFSVVKFPQLTCDEIAIWSGLASTDNEFSSPYFSPEFTRAVSTVRDDVYVAVLKENETPVGFFPHQRRWGIGQPVGGPFSDHHGVIVKPENNWDAIELLKACHLHVWEFSHLLAAQIPFLGYHRVLTHSPVIDISNGFSAYMEWQRAKGSKIILRLLRQRRQLERSLGPIRCEFESPDRNELNILLKWKSEQYLRTGLVDAFSFPWTRDLLCNIHSTRRPEFSGMLSSLYAGDTLVSAHMGMRSRVAWHYWFPAYSQEHAHFSPGLILLLEMLRGAEHLGIQYVDLGKGAALYKDLLMNGAVPIAEGLVEVDGWQTAVRRVWRRAEAWSRQRKTNRLISATRRIMGPALRRAVFR